MQARQWGSGGHIKCRFEVPHDLLRVGGEPDDQDQYHYPIDGTAADQAMTRAKGHTVGSKPLPASPPLGEPRIGQLQAVPPTMA